VKPQDLTKLQAYLRRTFGNSTIQVRARSKKDDSAEVYVGDEFIGVIFEDEEEGDYNLSMAILGADLD
jgi:Protein of unknown function (DUF3126)